MNRSMRTINGIFRYVVLTQAFVVLAACGGGGGGDDNVPAASNQDPRFSSGATASSQENITQTGYIATATDPEGNAVTYSITGGADQLAFSIDPASGELSFINAPDFENPSNAGTDNNYLVEITAMDGNGGSVSQIVTVTVTNVNDAPVFVSTSTANAPENTTQTGYIATAADPEGDTVTYSISGGADQSAFSIDSASGELSFISAPDFESPSDADTDNDYIVGITASDSNGGSTSLTVTLTVTNVDEPPPGNWVTGQGPFGGLINSMAVDSQGNMFVATGSSGCNGYSCGRNGIFRSRDDGATWSAANEGLTNLHVNSLAVNSLDEVFAGTYFGGIFKFVDDGSNWNEVSAGLPVSSVVDAIAVDSNDTVFAGTRDGEIFRSIDGGLNWEEVFLLGGSILSLSIDANDTIFAGGLSFSLESKDGGDNWIPITDFSGTNLRLVMQTQAGSLLAATFHGVYRSANGGLSWTLSAGLPVIFPVFPAVNSIVHASNGDLIAGTLAQGFHRSVNDGLNWTPTGVNSPRLTVIEVHRSPLDALFAATDGGVLRSDDDGGTWSYSNEGLANAIVKALVILADGSVYAGSGAGVARSTDFGSNWVDTSQGLPRAAGVSALLELPGGDLLAGTESSEVFRSTDLGANWQVLGALPAAAHPVTGISRDSLGSLFAVTGSGSSGSGAYRSTDDGVTWIPINNGFQDMSLQAIIVDENDTLFAAGKGVYRSVDSGASWQLVHVGGNNFAWDLALMPGVIFTATSVGVFHSTDAGSTWDAVPGAPTGWVQSIATSDTGDVYVGLFNSQSSGSATVGQYVYDSGAFVQIGDVFNDAVQLTPLSLAIGPAGRIYAGLSGGSVAVQ